MFRFVWICMVLIPLPLFLGATDSIRDRKVYSNLHVFVEHAVR